MTIRVNFTGFEILTAVIMKNTTSWVVTPCGLVKVTDVSEECYASIFMVDE
jgi:hypothetical protein